MIRQLRISNVTPTTGPIAVPVRAVLIGVWWSVGLGAVTAVTASGISVFELVLGTTAAVSGQILSSVRATVFSNGTTIVAGTAQENVFHPLYGIILEQDQVLSVVESASNISSSGYTALVLYSS